MSDNPPIEYAFPELRKWEKGAAPYVHVRESGKPGPTVMVTALTHGNEVSGAIVVDALLEQGVKPRTGTLILSFGNIDAYHSFDPRTPFKSRMVDEDFNRVWCRLDRPADTAEMKACPGSEALCRRADLLLDLHSMHDDGVPLMLQARSTGTALAKKLGAPVDIIRDAGHAPACACATTAASAIRRAQERATHRDRAALAGLVGGRGQGRGGPLPGGDRGRRGGDLPADWKQKPPPAQRVVE